VQGIANSADPQRQLRTVVVAFWGSSIRVGQIPVRVSQESVVGPRQAGLYACAGAL
jgi:hypothetical protein